MLERINDNQFSELVPELQAKVNQEDFDNMQVAFICPDCGEMEIYAIDNTEDGIVYQCFDCKTAMYARALVVE